MTAKHDLAPELVARLVATLFPAEPVVGVMPLRGGLESPVARVTIRDAGGRQRQVVVKRLQTAARREAARYRLLASSGATPSMLATLDHDGSTYLVLERVRPVSAWPWRDSRNTRRVLQQLAHVHRFGAAAPRLEDWDYEGELRASAAQTLAAAADAAASPSGIVRRRDLPPLRRVVASLAEGRRRMMPVLGETLIHGDVHSGNVILRGRAGDAAAPARRWRTSARGCFRCARGSRPPRAITTRSSAPTSTPPVSRRGSRPSCATRTGSPPRATRSPARCVISCTSRARRGDGGARTRSRRRARRCGSSAARTNG